MSGVRFFSGSRDQGSRSLASEIMRIEIRKQGKLPTADRYKRILKKKFEESKKKALGNRVKTFRLPGSLKEARAMSTRAEQALKEMAMKKAMKEEKALRKMVIVTPRTYPTGQINKKGKIYDVAGNMVAEVNTKNGKMYSMLGWSIGKYKPKSYLTDLVIQDAIQRYSPYFINLRKMQAMQQGSTTTVWGPADSQEVINLYGPTSSSPQDTASVGVHGSTTVARPQGNAGVTSWGVMSNNAWGTFGENAWGTMVDNVWGTTDSNVWGGIGRDGGVESLWGSTKSPWGNSGGLWGYRGFHIWGTGSGKNLLRGVTNRLAAVFGIRTKDVKSRIDKARGGRTGGSGGGPIRTSARTSR